VVNAYLAVMIGGAVGAGGRYAVGTMLSARLGPAFPWGTLAVNLIGGLAIGLLAGWLSRSGNDQLRLLLIVGVLGGFTTFSAFGLDAVELIGRGQLPRAMAYIAASVAGSIMLTALGLALARAS
jgi:fluoride exporter